MNRIDACTAAIKRSKGESCANARPSAHASTASGLQQADARRDVHGSAETEGPGLNLDEIRALIACNAWQFVAPVNPDTVPERAS